MPERNSDYLQELMSVVEVHLFHADAPGSQQISYLKQLTIQSRQQIFSYAPASSRSLITSLAAGDSSTGCVEAPAGGLFPQQLVAGAMHRLNG